MRAVTWAVGRALLCLLAAVLVLAAVPAAADRTADAAVWDFDEGMRRYRAGEFGAARDAFARALEYAPLESERHHWLGKAYGRMAERANPFSALTYATRTRKLFERAVELDPVNRAALVSLMEFYEEAPGFLGGSDDKAASLRARIEAIDASAARAVEAPAAEPSGSAPSPDTAPVPLPTGAAGR